jgi:site-specific DNA-methyltransferase (adenine-specific)
MNVILDTDRVSLIQGDTLETLRTFASNSFDIVVTDPPYNEHVHANLGKERRNDGHAARQELTFPPMTRDQIYKVVDQLVRITKGWIIIFSDFYNSHKWGEAVVANGGAWVRTGQWVKTSPMPQMTGDRPAAGSEDIVICHAAAQSRHWEWHGKGQPATWRGGRDQGGLHPNQKPAWLLQSLLGMFAPHGGLCLDPYFGSGTTAVAALSEERFTGEYPLETACKVCAKKIHERYAPPLPVDVKVVGVEGDPKYITVATERLKGLV